MATRGELVEIMGRESSRPAKVSPFKKPVQIAHASEVFILPDLDICGGRSQVIIWMVHNGIYVSLRNHHMETRNHVIVNTVLLSQQCARYCSGNADMNYHRHYYYYYMIPHETKITFQSD